MAPCTPFFDLLDDPVVQLIIRSVPDTRLNGSGCRSLSATCRRMCALVRCTKHFRWHRRPADLLRLTRTPAQRAFSNLVFLSVDDGEMEGIQGHAEYVDATAAAVATWPGLEEASLTCSNLAYEPGCMSGAFLALRAAPALRTLALSVNVPNSLAFLPVLTQLTALRVCGEGEPITLDIDDGSRPLAAMPHLLSLSLRVAELQPDASSVLPPNLTRLAMRCVELGQAGWAQHVAGCKQLQELSINTIASDITTHPTLVMQALGGQLTQLRRLCVTGEDLGEEWGEEQLDQVIDTLLPDTDSDGEEEWWPTPLLGKEQGVDVPHAYMAVPPPNMGGLSALQHLELWQWWLVVSSERYWRHLAACSNLQILSSLHAAVPPPAGVTFPGVTRLEVTTSTSPGDTLALLGAFPALKELELGVVLHPGPDSTSKLPAPGQVALQHATIAKLFFHNAPKLSPLGLRSCVRAYWRTLTPALPRLQQLDLSWADPVRLLSHQLGLSSLQQLAALVLSSRSGRCDVSLWGHAVGMEQVMRLVQGAAQLQEVSVRRPLGRGSSYDELLLGLQGALPGLRRLLLLCGPEDLKLATLAALRPGLYLHDWYAAVGESSCDSLDDGDLSDDWSSD